MAIGSAAVLVAVAAAPARAADVVCEPAERPRATVLYFHAGGFVDGRASDPGNLEICREFAAGGYLTRVVDYPLADLPGAVRSARRAAARHRGPRYAVGDSAGGTLAALLAARGQVDGAATFAAPMDLLTWPDDPRSWRRVNASRRDRIAASPLHRLTRDHAPMLLLHDPGDIVVRADQATRFVKRARRARFRPVRGQTYGHTWAPHHRRYILRWLDRRR